MTGERPDTKAPRPVVFGEVLFDRFPDGSRVLGGAPFNVAWHLRGFGLDPLFLSRVGDDEAGREIIDRMNRWGMDTDGVGVDHDHPTGSVRVTIENGEPSYEIVSGQAWDFMTASAGVPAPESDVILCHGTLAARAEVARAALEELRGRAWPNLFVDVNLRAPWWSPEIVENLLRGARWVKLNDQELSAALGRDEVPDGELEAGARSLAQRYELDLVIVTRGAKGALAVTEGETIRREPELVEVVDTVGAGDAFTAVSLAGLVEGWSPRTLLKRASGFASEICRRRGATHEEPELYRSFLARWCKEDE